MRFKIARFAAVWKLLVSDLRPERDNTTNNNNAILKFPSIGADNKHKHMQDQSYGTRKGGLYVHRVSIHRHSSACMPLKQQQQ